MLAVFFARDEEARHRFSTAELSDEWQESAFVGNWFVSLTPAQADELGRGLLGLVDELRARAPEPGAEQVLVTVRVLPAPGVK